MEHTLMDLMYKTPSDDTIRKCIVTKRGSGGNRRAGDHPRGRPSLLPRKQDTKTSRSRKEKASRKQLDEGNDINDKSVNIMPMICSTWDYGPSGDDRTL